MDTASFARWLFHLLLLWVGAEAMLVTVAKPMVLHPLKSSLDKLHSEAYWWAVKIALVICGVITLNATPWLPELDFFGRWNPDMPVYVANYGLEYTAWAGGFVSIMIVAFFGEKLHDSQVVRILLEKYGFTVPEPEPAPDA